jgi:hypothetical protein
MSLSYHKTGDAPKPAVEVDLHRAGLDEVPEQLVAEVVGAVHANVGRDALLKLREAGLWVRADRASPGMTYISILKAPVSDCGPYPEEKDSLEIGGLHIAAVPVAAI